MRRTVIAVLGVLAAVLVTAGCSAGPAATAAAPTSTNTSASTEPTSTAPSSSPPSATPRTAASLTNVNGATLNSHNNITKAIGQAAGITNGGGGQAVVSFSVTGIRLDPACDAPGAAKPMNGHYMAVDMTVTVTPAMPDPVFFAAKDFSIIGTDGVTDTDVVGYGFTCLRGQLTTDQLRPGQTYRGAIVLDTSVTRGQLQFTPASLDAANGWEWPIP